MKLFKKILKLLLFAACVLLLISSTSGDGAINIMTENYPPLNYIEKDVLKGPAVDVVREIMKKLKINSEISVVPWARGYHFILRKKNAALFSAARTDERSERTTFKSK